MGTSAERDTPPRGSWLFLPTVGGIAVVVIVVLLVGAFLGGGRSVDLRMTGLRADPATERITITARVAGSGVQLVIETTNQWTAEIRLVPPEVSDIFEAPGGRVALLGEGCSLGDSRGSVVMQCQDISREVTLEPGETDRRRVAVTVVSGRPSGGFEASGTVSYAEEADESFETIRLTLELIAQ